MKRSRKAIAVRAEQMRSDPVYRPALMQFAFTWEVRACRGEFATERQYLLQTDQPYSAEVALGLARLVIEGFIAADRLRAAA